MRPSPLTFLRWERGREILVSVKMYHAFVFIHTEGKIMNVIRVHLPHDRITIEPFPFPSTTMAWTPNRPSLCPAVPPTLASLIPPVNGLFPPMDSRPELGALVPARRPGATINGFSPERGWTVGETYSVIQ